MLVHVRRLCFRLVAMRSYWHFQGHQVHEVGRRMLRHRLEELVIACQVVLLVLRQVDRHHVVPVHVVVRVKIVMTCSEVKRLMERVCRAHKLGVLNGVFAQGAGSPVVVIVPEVIPVDLFFLQGDLHRRFIEFRTNAERSDALGLLLLLLLSDRLLKWTHLCLRVLAGLASLSRFPFLATRLRRRISGRLGAIEFAGVVPSVDRDGDVEVVGLRDGARVARGHFHIDYRRRSRVRVPGAERSCLLHHRVCHRHLRLLHRHLHLRVHRLHRRGEGRHHLRDGFLEADKGGQGGWHLFTHRRDHLRI
mmetsp:Transcript_11977/g.16267  ORF Transcript_11977/g.16267 Transcript_11977/m.16267 type:complete len:305 (+) Transcript_11977:384-1298(+)